ncbi:nuclear transport factor 2 family protein [Ruegeria pomeroyi]|uniref:Nuclear transport factor 2 family protein n=1 Tax=Ruegeria alba TaxID=2916756 RepID=A0ABS9NZB2_9RHOB|nr:ketosteroid isomerase-related protein [Ruegeria alba]MCE8514100.1 nuclear transport factor 2 family protein [Ruegeria pomeroyi]MCE8516814.1 nuclear transport factor 2 family protein [Ruegeria pomeroyi]MCE8522113.1 nuclear transport factor 2 family protein [Ruegeria pomeroyi]MCE8525702.1 nuclear transport factor 2 family protein [Ruegeria pomeroyi]MCE8530822.1 nuclear transport factor 2 family protein [Ruegeria pomeroyi]
MSETVKRYFDAFNAGDVQGMLDCLSEDVAHHVNEGQIRVGKEKFADFCAHMNRCYKELLTDIVVFEAEGGTRAAAEFIVNGTYLQTDSGLPEAHGQTYRLPAGSFFTLTGDKISRVTTFYNLADWVKQVSNG